MPADMPADESRMEMLKADVAELRELVQACKRPKPNEGGSASSVHYQSIASFGWDQDDYGKEPSNVYVYLMTGMEGVGQCKERVTCDFEKNSFDLKILDFNGKNFRLLKNNLDKDIVPEASKVVVKKNRVTITLRKVKGTYGYDQWLDLTAKRAKSEDKKDDPSAGIMDMMKQMYDEGDDTMKKTIGEAMMKSRQTDKPGLDLGDKSGLDLDSDSF